VAARTAEIEIEVADPGPAPGELPLAVGQVVLSATSVPGVDRVRLLRDGEPLDAPLPDGELTSRPLTASAFASLLAE
jgi:hypothetical protein